MLSHLTIRQLAVIEEASLEFSSGLNVLTGETGAGKSVIIDALDLLRGSQRSRARVRTGAAAASIEAQCLPSPEVVARLQPIFERYDLPLQDELILARRLEASGRTRSYVQGRLVPRSVLAEVGELLIEICGQHESHALRSPAAQLAALDRFAGLEDEVEAFSCAHDELKTLEARFHEAKNQQMALETRRELIELQLSELSECALDEYAEGRRRIELAQAAAELEGLAGEVRGVLEDGDDAVSERVKWLLRRTNLLVESRAEEPTLLGLRERLVRALDAIDEAVKAAGALVRQDFIEPGELDQLNEQLARIERLARKYRRSPEELTAVQEQWRRELAELADLSERTPALERELATQTRRVEALAAQLHERRCRAARRLERAIAKELGELCLVNAELRLDVQRAPLTSSETSQVQLLFSGNPGLSPAPLGRVASGGELSRVLLALRVASRQGQGTTVFDEIDAGAGGHVAERIGERLQRAAETGQVICVTHWPQVAAYADAHWLVHKSSGETARTVVHRVDGDGRLDELSRMLGGSRRSARGHAVHLLGEAQKSGISSSGHRRAGIAPAAC